MQLAIIIHSNKYFRPYSFASLPLDRFAKKTQKQFVFLFKNNKYIIINDKIIVNQYIIRNMQIELFFIHIRTSSSIDP